MNRRGGRQSRRNPNAGQSSFLPNNIPGLLLDLDSRYGITIATGVSAWADQSGNGNNAAQATGAKQPTYNSAGGPNGMPYLGFASASSQYLTNSTAIIPSSGTPPSVGCTVFIVHQFSSLATHLMSFGTSSAGGGIATSVSETLQNGREIFLQGIAGEAESVAAATTSWEQWTVTSTGTSNTANNQTLRVNGSSIALAANNNVPGTSTNGYTVGQYGSLTAGYYLNGGITRILVYGSVLIASQITQVEAYLKGLCGV